MKFCQVAKCDKHAECSYGYFLSYVYHTSPRKGILCSKFEENWSNDKFKLATFTDGINNTLVFHAHFLAAQHITNKSKCTYSYGQGGILHFLMCMSRLSVGRLSQNRASTTFLVPTFWQWIFDLCTPTDENTWCHYSMKYW